MTPPAQHAAQLLHAAQRHIADAAIDQPRPVALKAVTRRRPETDTARLPRAVVTGPALVDFSNATDPVIRSGVALALLFASRVAGPATDADDWLGRYTDSLDRLGFARAGQAMVDTSFDKAGIAVHQAIIPFLTIALGGATLGPVILAGLQNLAEADADAPWITLYDRQSRRFDAQELHFATVSSTATQTHIRYAIARLSARVSSTGILFAKLGHAEAQFQSAAMTMAADNALLAKIEPALRARLAEQSQDYIRAAFIDAV